MKSYSVQGAGHDQLVDSSWIGWHQGEVSSIIHLLVSTSLDSVFCSQQFSSGGSLLPIKNKLGMCVKPLAVSFRELEVWQFCYGAEI